MKIPPLGDSSAKKKKKKQKKKKETKKKTKKKRGGGGGGGGGGQNHLRGLLALGKKGTKRGAFSDEEMTGHPAERPRR